jgi:tetratricopeptide (TPR) repeat protein
MAKPDLILHIGQSKTGTSSIQRVLGARRAALAAERVCYPRSPGYANHGLLPASLVPVEMLGHFHPNLWEGAGPEARLARFRREFADELAQLPADTRLIVLSAEQCGGLLTTPDDVGRLRDMLAPHVGAVRVVMYLRRQDSHFASGYVQALRVAHIGAPVLPQAGPEQIRHYDYAAILDLWAGVFGDAAIQPRLFERACLRNGDVVDDFLHLAGIAMTVPPDDPDRMANQSLTPGGIDLVRAVGQAMQASPGGLAASSPLWRRFVDAANAALPGQGWKPAPAEAAAFLARFSAVNEAVRRRWFPDRPALFADAPRVPPAERPAPPPPIDTAAALDAAVTLLLAELNAASQREAALHTNIGRLLEKLGEHEHALGAWRAAIRAVPDHAPAQFRLAEAALAAGDRKTAEGHLAVLQAAHPDHALTQRLARRIARPEHAKPDWGSR